MKLKLFSFLYGILIYLYMIFSFNVLDWIIPYKLVVVILWFVCLFFVLYKTAIKFVKLLEKYR